MCRPPPFEVVGGRPADATINSSRADTGVISPSSVRSPTWRSTKSSSQPSCVMKYAKQFALLTVLTAWLGKLKSEGVVVASSSGSGIFGLGLYEYFLPGSTNYLVYLVVLLYAANKIWKAFTFHVSNLRRATSEAIQTVTSAQALSRIRSTVSTSSIRFLRGTAEEGKRSIVIASSEPFISAKVMEQMTLKDIAHVFSYSMRVNQEGFDHADFLRECRAPTREAIHALERVVSISRGPETVMLETKSGSASDAMDGLAFAAASRIFAEWRGVRAIPEGYPKFAFGMGLARRDLIQNIRKIELAVHNWLDAHQGVLVSASKHEIRQTSPTLRQLLQHEIEVCLHPKLPCLMEHSAGSGILWTKRQLQYQSFALDYNARVPVDFPSPKAAFNAAYEAVYRDYHGWLVRSVFQNTFDCAPPAKEVLHHMNLPYSQEPTPCTEGENLERVPEEIEDDGDSWVQLPIEEDDDPSAEKLNESDQWESLGPQQHQCYEVGNGTEEEQKVQIGERVLQIFSSAFGHCVVGNREMRESKNAMAGMDHRDQRDGASNNSNNAEPYLEQNDVPFYLSVLRSLEGGIDSLVADMNMNDPSRV